MDMVAYYESCPFPPEIVVVLWRQHPRLVAMPLVIGSWRMLTLTLNSISFRISNSSPLHHQLRLVMSMTTPFRSFVCTAIRNFNYRPQSPLRSRLPAAFKYLHTSPRAHALSSSIQSGRKQIATKDSSSKKWGDLSKGQKVMRTASTGTNAAVVLAGLALTVRLT
jgi:hypothetical protein